MMHMLSSPVQKQYNAPNSLVVTFGCSYSGALAAWFRMKYPESAIVFFIRPFMRDSNANVVVTVGSIAGSAPVHAVADFYEYMVRICA